MEKEREQLEDLLSRDKPAQSNSYAAVSNTFKYFWLFMKKLP